MVKVDSDTYKHLGIILNNRWTIVKRSLTPKEPRINKTIREQIKWIIVSVKLLYITKKNQKILFRGKLWQINKKKY